MTDTLDGLADRLRNVSLFRDLPHDLLALLAERGEVRRVPAGTVLFRQGDPGREFLVVLEGRIRIEIPGGGGPEPVAELGPGAWFGEMAPITGEPRSAGARVIRDALLLVLGPEAFAGAMDQQPELALALGRELSRRLRTTLLERSPRRRPRVLVLPGEVAPEALARLQAVLEDELHGAVPVRTSPDAAELEPLVRSHPLVLVAGRAPRAFPEAVEVDGLAVDALRLDPAPPSSLLASGLQARVRAVLGRRIGLALGAGGAKGLAHVGAVRALARAGIRVDLLAGSSIGAVVAGMIALGWEPAQIEGFFRTLSRNVRRLLLDVGLASGALLGGAKKRRLFQEGAGDRLLEGLPVPLAVPTADLRGGRERLLENGPLWRALDATTAVPTVFPPVPWDQAVLADGWIVNPLPTEALRRGGADLVIAVDPAAADDGAVPPGLAALDPQHPRRWSARRLFDPIGAIEVAMRALYVGARERAAVSLARADVPITPALGEWSCTAFGRLDEIAARGEAAAEQALRSSPLLLPAAVPA